QRAQQSATRKVPNIPVLTWDTFLTNAFNASTSLDTSNRIFSSVVDIFLKMMESINNKRLILLQRPESWGKCYMFQRVKGRPDVIRCSADNKKLSNNLQASQILSAVEIKP
ncbi:3862_t:CDS:1, partial [Ambispora gerdemannii]